MLHRSSWPARFRFILAFALLSACAPGDPAQASTPHAGASVHAPVQAHTGVALPTIGRVTHCFDGDSFTMLTSAGEEEVRLWGVDAPEHDQPYGKNAGAFAKRHWEGQQVFVVSDHGIDRYGRRLLELKLANGQEIQRLLLDSGCAWYYKQYAAERTDFAQEEAAAKKRKSGLWREANPIAPWDWRREHRKE